MTCRPPLRGPPKRRPPTDQRGWRRPPPTARHVRFTVRMRTGGSWGACSGDGSNGIECTSGRGGTGRTATGAMGEGGGGGGGGGGEEGAACQTRPPCQLSRHVPVAPLLLPPYRFWTGVDVWQRRRCCRRGGGGARNRDYVAGRRLGGSGPPQLTQLLAGDGCRARALQRQRGGHILGRAGGGGSVLPAGPPPGCLSGPPQDAAAASCWRAYPRSRSARASVGGWGR